jgi:ABC-type transport system involved in cytochrome c biogenesis ATPase subunit
MGNLILSSLEIQGFRGFRHLQIEKLGRVNLVVGKNNVGKSSLLDALQIYASEADPNIVWQLLRARDESRYDPYDRERRVPGDIGIGSQLAGLKYLFYGREEIDIGMRLAPIVIGPMHSVTDSLNLSIGWFTMEMDEEEGIRKLRMLQPEKYDNAENPLPGFIVSFKGISRNYLLGRVGFPGLNKQIFNCISITANGLDRGLMEDFWDGIVLREAEADILAALRIIAPGIERLNLVGDTKFRQRLIRESSLRDREQRTAVPIVKVTGIKEPIPLASLGGGMQRALGIALALVNARDGMLLIDEFENGLHYSVQADLWRLIFQIARRLNVQVFATTHSWDCIEGFQKAAQEDKLEEGVFMRLQSRNGEISATVYNEEELAIATREQIEVR